MLVKALEAQVLLQVVVVAVTRFITYFILFNLSILTGTAHAAVLPEDRVDILYHNYDGGGITIDGPSVLVRKSFADQVSVSANYYVDNITSASIDAILQASEYTEKRVQNSVGVDYLNDKATVSYSYTSSSENDYEAITQSFGISQEMFGGLTTLSMGYTFGDNIVTKTGDENFSDFAKFKNYRASIAQVLTKNLITSVNYDIITDEGFLNNPYRSVRVETSDTATFPLGYTYQLEKYPRTRTTNAISLGFRYYLPYRAAIFGSYRYFTDSWDIKADTYELGYAHPLEEHWTFETSLRLYSQTQANFYQDLFPEGVTQNVYARDKELSTFTDYSINLGVTYEFNSESLFFFERGSANFFYTYFFFDYENFRDLRAEDPLVAAGTEPLYNFSAAVTRLYLSFWF